MSKALVLSTLFTLLFIAFTGSHKLQAAQIGDTFTDETGMITFEVKDTGKENICSVIGWKNEFDDVNLVNNIKLVIPETVVYEDTLYAVTSIESSKGTIYSEWISEMEIPASIKSIKVNHFTFDLERNPESEKVKEIHGVNFVFKCSPDAFEQIESIDVNDAAIESIIYVPEEYLEEYKALFAGKLRCIFLDNDRGIRSYTGIPIAKIGDSSVNPEAFIFEDSYYRILNPDKKTVSLICSYALKKKGIKGTCYTQPSIVYYKGEKYKVTKIEYYAFCNVRFDEPVELKLPNTITSIGSKSIGWNITRLDISETKIKKIPTYLVNSYYDECDSPAVIKEVILPETCRKLQKHAFYNCKKLKNIVMPENVTIGYHALRKKCNITRVNVSKSEVDPIKEIFSENNKFALVCDGEEKEVSISDIPGIFAPNDPYMKIWNFAIVDLDGDGIKELLLEIYGVSRDMGGYVVFHKENNKVSAYKSENYRTFWFLKEDGTYTYSEGAGTNDGYAKVLSFNENGYEEDKYTYLIDDHQGKIEYIVDHKSVTEEEFKNATVIQNSKKDIVWHEFSIENIGLFVNE